MKFTSIEVITMRQLVSEKIFNMKDNLNYLKEHDGPDYDNPEYEKLIKMHEDLEKKLNILFEETISDESKMRIKKYLD